MLFYLTLRQLTQYLALIIREKREYDVSDDPSYSDSTHSQHAARPRSKRRPQYVELPEFSDHYDREEGFNNSYHDQRLRESVPPYPPHISNPNEPHSPRYSPQPTHSSHPSGQSGKQYHLVIEPSYDLPSNPHFAYSMDQSQSYHSYQPQHYPPQPHQHHYPQLSHLSPLPPPQIPHSPAPLPPSPSPQYLQPIPQYPPRQSSPQTSPINPLPQNPSRPPGWTFRII